MFFYSAAVSILTLPECKLLVNPGQFSKPSTEHRHPGIDIYTYIYNYNIIYIYE